MTDGTIQLNTLERGAKVAAVVVTYQRKALLKECVEALLRQERLNQILIVDNASSDGTKEYVWDLVDGTHVIYQNTGKNLGGAGGFSFGIKEAVKLNCDYVWLMDDDCIVQDNTLSELLACAERLNGDFGFLSSVVKWTDGSVCDMNVQRKSITNQVTDFSKEAQSIMLASFVSMFLNVKAVRELGLPIKEFFIWGDDWEYTSRISKKYKNYLVPKSVVIHKSASNLRVDIVQDSLDRLDRYFYAYRNEKYLFDRLGTKGRLYYFAKVWYHRLLILFANTQNKKEKLHIIKKGLKASKSFKPQIEYIN